MAKKKNKRRVKKEKSPQEVIANLKATTDEEKDKANDNNIASKETAKKEEVVVGDNVLNSTKSDATPARGDEGYDEFLSLLKGDPEDTIITAVSKDEDDEMEDGPNYLPKGLSSATTEEAEGSSTSTMEDLSPMVASRDSESSFIGDVDLNSNDSESANLLPPLPDKQVVDEKGLVDDDEKKDQGGLAQKFDYKEKIVDGLEAETTTKEENVVEKEEWVVVEDLPSGEGTGESSDQALRETVVDKKKDDTWGKLARKIAARACCLKSLRSNTNAI